MSPATGTPAFLNQQRRMARGMRLMLDNPDLRAIPGNLRHLGGQAGNEAEQVQRYLLGDVRRYQRGDAGLRTRVRQPISDSSRTARRAVTRRRAEPGVPEQVIPMRMRREACHNGLAQLAKVVREAGHFVALHPGVDEQHASPALHDNGVALAELALVDQHTLRDLPQHGAPSACGLHTMGEAYEPRSGCPINAAIEVFGDRWSLIVLRDIVFGDRRYFRELQAGSLEGIASNILADRLKQLVKLGLLTREDTRPGQRARYSLAEPAIQLVPVFAQLGSWGLRHRPTSSALNARAELLEQGGPALWQEFMDELRHSHLGSDTPPRSPSVRERLNEAYLAATNSS